MGLPSFAHSRADEHFSQTLLESGLWFNQQKPKVRPRGMDH